MPSDETDPLRHCRVCGRLHDDYPWGSDGLTPSFEICPCCGTEFGYEDATPEGVLKARADWQDRGYDWQEPCLRPNDWDAAAQLAGVPMGGWGEI